MFLVLLFFLTVPCLHRAWLAPVKHRSDVTAVCHIHSVPSILAADDQEVLRTKEDSPSKSGSKDGWL